MVLLSLVLTGCGQSLTADVACDQSSTWLAQNSVLLSTGDAVYDPTIEGCNGFLSREEDATIDVTIGYELDDEYATYGTTNVECLFFNYDQGWAIESCYDETF